MVVCGGEGKNEVDGVGYGSNHKRHAQTLGDVVRTYT